MRGLEPVFHPLKLFHIEDMPSIKILAFNDKKQNC